MFMCWNCILFKNNIGEIRSVQTTVEHIKTQFKGPYWYPFVMAMELASVSINNLSHFPKFQQKTEYTVTRWNDHMKNSCSAQKCLDYYLVFETKYPNHQESNPQLSKSHKTILNAHSVLQTVTSREFPRQVLKFPKYLETFTFQIHKTNLDVF